MSWKQQRAVGTLIAMFPPFIAALFVAWDFNPAHWPVIIRTAAATGCLFLGVATFTYPGWKWPD